MRHLLAGMAVLVALTWAPAWSQSPSASPAAKKPGNNGIPATVHWVSTWDEAWHASRKTRHPILLMFCTSWSPLCQKMDESVWSLPKLRLLSTQYVMCRLDAEKDVLFANHFKVVGYPTILLSYEGHALGRDVGLVPVPHLVDMMQKGIRATRAIQGQVP